MNECLFSGLQELRQYPTLRVEVVNAATEALERMRDESKRATLQLVDMECGYLTVDFFRKLPQDVEKGGNPTHSIFDRYNDSYLRRIGKPLSHLNHIYLDNISYANCDPCFNFGSIIFVFLAYHRI